MKSFKCDLINKIIIHKAFVVGCSLIITGLFFWEVGYYPPENENGLQWTVIEESRNRNGFKISPGSFLGIAEDGSEKVYTVLSLTKKKSRLNQRLNKIKLKLQIRLV